MIISHFQQEYNSTGRNKKYRAPNLCIIDTYFRQQCGDTFFRKVKNGEGFENHGWQNYIKFAIWGIWLIIVGVCYFHNREIIAIDFFFETENDISVSSVQSYTIYYGIICLIFIPSILLGKRAMCHYFCWMDPFMILGIKLRRILHLPGIHIKADKKNCVSRGKCNKVCPMGIDVMSEIKHDKIINQEFIQCGACIDNCPKNVLTFGIIKDEKQAITHIEAFERKIEEELLYLLRAKTNLNNNLNDNTAHKYYLLTVEFGIKTYQTYLEWCKEAKKILMNA